MTRRFVGCVVCVLGAAVLAFGCTGGAEGSREPSAAPVPAAPSVSTQAERRVLPPSNFVAKAAMLQIVLSWSPPPEHVQSYVLYRDGVTLQRDVPGTETTFVDRTTAPGTEYTYEIEAVGANGSVSDRVASGARTGVPPLRAARLANDFTVTARFLSKSGYGDYDPSTYGWRFRPLCRKGACDVVWRDMHEREIRTRLQRRGKRYGGSYTGFFGLQCGSTNVTSTVTVSFEVTMARVIDGRWVATRFKGRLDQAESEQLGCRSSEATLAVSGRLVR